MKIKNPLVLMASIAVSQLAGLIGTFFTFDAIPTWYQTLNRPSFAPPNWVFGPVWTVLYTLIGISLYLIATNKKKISLKLFWFHLFLNAIWSPIFFGLKNLGLALIVIIIMDITLIVIIKNFYKINKNSAFLLLPYLMWISFATILNFSFWQLNTANINTVFAEELTFEKAKNDFIFEQDRYKEAERDLNLKKDSYNKNNTLLLKDELRVSLYNFVNTRNKYFKSYLTLIRTKTVESQGLNNTEKQSVYEKIDPQVVWFEQRTTRYNPNDSLEDLLTKSDEEKVKYETETINTIKFTLAKISYGEITKIENDHKILYESLKNEAEELVRLNRADLNLFTRWFTDIDNTLKKIDESKQKTNKNIDLLYSSESYERREAYENTIEEMNLNIANIARLNNYLNELEEVLKTKR